MKLSEYGDEDLIEELAERGIKVVYKKDVEKKLAEMDVSLQEWRGEEKKGVFGKSGKKWGEGYNDGFEGAITSFKKLIK